MVASTYNLLMPEKRVGHPYQDSGTGPVDGTRVNLTYHHVVPYSTLRKFWAKAAGANMLRRSMFFEKLRPGLTKRFYVDLTKASGSQFKDSEIGQVDTLAGRFYSGDAVHTSDEAAAYRRPEGWDNFLIVYTWLPGNLFLGPTSRSDDPGDKFEEVARPIFAKYGDARFDELRSLDAAIRTYLDSADGTSSGPAFKLLANVARHPRLVPFNGTEWKLNNEGAAYVKNVR